MSTSKQELNQQREQLQRKSDKIANAKTTFGVLLFVGVLCLAALIALIYKGGVFTDTMSLARAAFSGATTEAHANLLTGTAEQLTIVYTQANPLGGFFALEDIQLEQDAQDPDVVHYSCSVPGPCNTAYELLLHKNIKKDEQVSPRITMSGTLRIEKTVSGKRRVSLGDGQNPLWLRACVANIGMDGSLPGFNVAGVYSSEEEFTQTQIGILMQVGMAYAEALGDEGFIDDVVIAQLPGYVDFLNEDPSFSKKNDYGQRLPITTMIESIMVPVGAVFGVSLLLLVIYILLAVKRAKLAQKDSAYASEIWQIEKAEDARAAAANRKAALKAQQEALKNKVAESGRELRRRISIANKPNREREFLNDLNNDFDKALHRPDRQGIITRGGWSLMALIRCMVSDYTLETRKKTAELLQTVLDDYNQMAEEYNSNVREIRKFATKQYHLLTTDEREKYETIKRTLSQLEERLAGGLLKRCLDANCVPLDYFVHLACDRHGADRFLRQCALIGILPWLEANQGDQEIAEKLNRVNAARAEMISGAEQMAFFEVRVPPDCKVEEYADLLGETLRYANPNLAYCDLRAMMKRAAQEVPGVMELLRFYPLRLIDEKNSAVEGFFEFKPFIHTMWVQYHPPINVGQVQRRYHEALDMTKPNASGINIRLFEDEYAVIPVFFHEYCHYCGDHNEASVWLRTQLFSQQFYKKYEDSDPTADFTFVHMQNLLGAKPNPDQFEELGRFIEKYYGKQVSQEDGNRMAMARIAQINQMVTVSNMSTTWFPEVTFQMLNDEDSGDKTTYHLILEAVKRYATMPRTISRAHFVAVTERYEPEEMQESAKPSIEDILE